jgi:cell division transport system permease protein
MKRFDFPFSGRDSYAALPWILAFMVFLTLLCASVTLNIQTATQNWHQQYDFRLSLQIPSVIAKDEAALARTLDAIGHASGVTRVEPLRREAVDLLLKPWLGDGVRSETLPIPALVDVTLVPDMAADGAFRSWLGEYYPDIRVDDHAAWLNDFNRLVRSAGWLAIGVVGLIAAVTMVIIVMSTRTELTLHRATLELLRALGAEDFYIANQFQAKALWMSVQGTVAGVICALVTMLVFARISTHIQAPFLPLLDFSGAHVWLFLVIGTLAVGLTVMAARVTTYRELRAPAFKVGV